MEKIIITGNKYEDWKKRLKIYDRLRKEKKISIITNDNEFEFYKRELKEYKIMILKLKYTRIITNNEKDLNIEIIYKIKAENITSIQEEIKLIEEIKKEIKK